MSPRGLTLEAIETHAGTEIHGKSGVLEPSSNGNRGRRYGGLKVKEHIVVC